MIDDSTSGGAAKQRRGRLNLKRYSRDANYLRDVFLFWPFIILSIIGVGCLLSPAHRQLGIRCAALAAVAILFAKERLLIFFAGLGFVAIQAALNLIAQPWSWSTFTVGVFTGVSFLAANRYWRKPKLAYQLPRQFGAVDMLLSFASICTTICLFYFIVPRK